MLFKIMAHSCPATAHFFTEALAGVPQRSAIGEQQYYYRCTSQ